MGGPRIKSLVKTIEEFTASALKSLGEERPENKISVSIILACQALMLEVTKTLSGVPRRMKWEYKGVKMSGMFVQFGVDYQEFESGPGNYSTVIVEMDDGSVRAYSINMMEGLRFVNQVPTNKMEDHENGTD